MIIDHLSKNLRDKYPGRPAVNRPRKYVLLGVKMKTLIDEDGVTTVTVLECPKSYTLPSSYVIRDGDELKTISLVEKELPAPLTSNKDVLKVPGRVSFMREEQGEIKISNENYNRLAEVDKFLFYSPWNENNHDKDFFIPTDLGFVYKHVDKSAVSVDYVKQDKAVFEAKEIIYNLVDYDKEILIETLALGKPEYMDKSERTAVLLRYAEKMDKNGNPANALNVKRLARGEELKLKKIIRKAVRDKVIKYHHQWSAWVWADSNDRITTQLPGKSPEESLMIYFVTDKGESVLEILKNVGKKAGVGEKATKG